MGGPIAGQAGQSGGKNFGKLQFDFLTSQVEIVRGAAKGKTLTQATIETGLKLGKEAISLPFKSSADVLKVGLEYGNQFRILNNITFGMLGKGASWLRLR